MKLARNHIILSASLSVLALTLPVSAQQSAPDNTKQNAKPQTTADHQVSGQSDRSAAAHIRRTVVKDKSLSTYAHNVKIVVKGGQVTLSGPVHTEEEKTKVAADAATVVDAASITNQITVKQPK